MRLAGPFEADGDIGWRYLGYGVCGRGLQQTGELIADFVSPMVTDRRLLHGVGGLGRVGGRFSRDRICRSGCASVRQDANDDRGSQEHLK